MGKQLVFNYKDYKDLTGKYLIFNKKDYKDKVNNNSNKETIIHQHQVSNQHKLILQ